MSRRYKPDVSSSRTFLTLFSETLNDGISLQLLYLNLVYLQKRARPARLANKPRRTHDAPTQGSDLPLLGAPPEPRLYRPLLPQDPHPLSRQLVHDRDAFSPTRNEELVRLLRLHVEFGTFRAFLVKTYEQR